MKEPLVFVGTMYSGEGDFTSCCRAILTQKGAQIQHYVIANQPEKIAHNLLWAAWRSVQHTGFDMFLKVDADTVLANDEIVSRYWQLMNSNPRITGIQAPLHDYFTDGHINGLNCFSPKVTFNDTVDPLYCDRRVDVDHDLVIGSDLVPSTLRPAGLHCHEANEKQAFHYGFHRALKNQVDVLSRVRAAWHHHGNDRLRGLALLGARASRQHPTSFNYDDSAFRQLFQDACEQYDELSATL